ncbi:50S ribosomal protein L32e [archaeon]|nr:50S ribosomal protein L32e [archaeon]
MNETLLKIRAEMKKKRPSFVRSEGNSKNTRRTNDSWRKPKGRDNKLRRRVNGEGVVSKGYSVPPAVRGLHACGLNDIVVSNINDIQKLNSKTDAARISATVGIKKKITLLAEATKLKIKVLNPLYKKKKKEIKEKTIKETKLTKKDTVKDKKTTVKTEDTKEKTKKASKKTAETKT